MNYLPFPQLCYVWLVKDHFLITKKYQLRGPTVRAWVPHQVTCIKAMVIFKLRTKFIDSKFSRDDLLAICGSRHPRKWLKKYSYSQNI